VLIRSISVATHQLRSSGHQRLALCGHVLVENEVLAALNGPRRSTIGRCGIEIRGTAHSECGVSP